jgi:hypothetical protein
MRISGIIPCDNAARWIARVGALAPVLRLFVGCAGAGSGLAREAITIKRRMRGLPSSRALES